ncbi:MAG: membrane protein insertion efficiency factor YidD [Arsenophonus sp.]|nr:MAG: membrane protein insertion efficiency factor YidD [Arsenophonus sp.]
MEILSSFLRKKLILIIKIYQLFFSILKQPCCRFHPTCSEYAIQTLSTFKLIKSIFLIIKRIIKCHPLS